MYSPGQWRALKAQRDDLLWSLKVAKAAIDGELNTADVYATICQSIEKVEGKWAKV